jgi:hypothetical protein
MIHRSLPLPSRMNNKQGLQSLLWDCASRDWKQQVGLYGSALLYPTLVPNAASIFPYIELSQQRSYCHSLSSSDWRLALTRVKILPRWLWHYYHADQSSQLVNREVSSRESSPVSHSHPRTASNTPKHVSRRHRSLAMCDRKLHIAMRPTVVSELLQKWHDFLQPTWLIQ